MPTTYPIGTKRIPIDSGYYEAYNRDNVTLVDLRDTPIVEVTEKGIRTTEGERELDIIIYATGFDAFTGSLLALNIEGRNGVKLADKWLDGPRSYLGVAVAGFPNLFTITGPGSPSVLSNMPVSIEQHVEWIGRFVKQLVEEGAEYAEATGEAEEAWTEPRRRCRRPNLVPEGGLVVHGRQHRGQGAHVPPLHRRRRPLPDHLRRDRRRRLPGLPDPGPPGRDRRAIWVRIAVLQRTRNARTGNHLELTNVIFRPAAMFAAVNPDPACQRSHCLAARQFY